MDASEVKHGGAETANAPAAPAAPSAPADPHAPLRRWLRVPSLSFAAALAAVSAAYFAAGLFGAPETLYRRLNAALLVVGIGLFGLAVSNVILDLIIAASGTPRRTGAMLLGAVGWGALAALGLGAALVSTFFSTLAAGFSG